MQFVVDGVNFGGPVPLVGGSATGAPLGNLGAGSHTILARYSGDGHYAANTDHLTQAVNKAHLTVTADPKADRFGDALPALTATISGFVNGDGPGVVGGSPGLTTAATSASGAGTYAIMVGGDALRGELRLPEPRRWHADHQQGHPDDHLVQPGRHHLRHALGLAQLNATVTATGPDPTTGALTYSPAPGTVLHAGPARP